MRVPLAAAAALALPLLAAIPALAQPASGPGAEGAVQMAGLARRPLARPARTSGWSAAYLAPGSGFTVSAGHSDRAEAEAAAQAACLREASDCRPVGSIAGGRCGALAQPLERGMIFAAARPLSLAAPVLGAGADEAAATEAALRACLRQAGHGRMCLILAAGCGPR